MKRLQSHLALLFISLLFSPLLQAQSENTELKFKLGGLVRFSYNNSSWKNAQQKRGGDLGNDCVGIKAKADYGSLFLDAEYRFYSSASGGDFLKYGFMGYRFNEESTLRLGVVPVPFGNSGVNSNSFFYSVNYFIGLEDDYDAGISYSKEIDRWLFDVAFMKNAEDLSMSDLGDLNYSRFGYDVSSFSDAEGNLVYRNKETNHFNARAIYTLECANSTHELGGSFLVGQLLNLDTQKMGSRMAWAAHYNGTAGRFNLKAEVAAYNYSAKNPTGQDADVIAMAAFGAPYLVASEGVNYTIGLSYCLPVESKLFDSFTFYNDFGVMDKKVSSFENSLMNVTGVLISAGPIYTYVDYALGKNQPWLGPQWSHALAQGDTDATWHARFNVNIGFYF